MSKSTVDKKPPRVPRFQCIWPGGALFSGSVGARALVCAVLHPLTLGVSVARLFHGLFSSSHQGEERARIPAEFRARVFKPLGVSDALREGLKTTSGGRLASSAGV